MKYRNDTGGSIRIPIPLDGSNLVGAIDGFTEIEDGSTFDPALDDQGELINPTLRVLAEAGQIVPASAPKTGSSKKKTRKAG